MFSPNFRLFLIALFFVAGLLSLLTSVGGYVVFAFWGTAVILLVGHFKYGPILGALMALRKGNVAESEQLLNSIKRPQWLSPRYQAYYHFATALVASHQQDIDSAEVHSLKALEIGLLQHQEQAILLYNLARVAFERKEWDKSQTNLQKLQSLSIEDLHLKKRMQELENALKNIQNAKNN